MLTAGTLVKGGFYFNRDNLDLITVSGKEGALPGADGQRYLKVPVLAVLLLAPALGGLFVIFMPFIGFALVFQQLGRLMISGVRRANRSLRRAGEGPSFGKDGEERKPKGSAEAKTDEDKAGKQ